MTRRIFRAHFYNTLHVTAFRTDESACNLKVLFIVYLYVKSTCVLYNILIVILTFASWLKLSLFGLIRLARGKFTSSNLLILWWKSVLVNIWITLKGLVLLVCSSRHKVRLFDVLLWQKWRVTFKCVVCFICVNFIVRITFNVIFLLVLRVQTRFGNPFYDKLCIVFCNNPVVEVLLGKVGAEEIFVCNCRLF